MKTKTKKRLSGPVKIYGAWGWGRLVDGDADTLEWGWGGRVDAVKKQTHNSNSENNTLSRNTPSKNIFCRNS